MQKQKEKIVKFFWVASTTFFLTVSGTQTTSAQWDVTRYNGTGLPKQQLGNIISNIAMWLLAVFGFIAVIGFVISGIIYFVSAGDEDAQERAKRAMMYSITGVIVGLAGLVVIYAVNYFLGGGSGTVGNVINSATSSPATGAVSR